MLKIYVGDITKVKVDAIVNAANTSLTINKGICEAIFKAADTKKLIDACKAFGYCKPSRVVVTPSFGLPCKYIFHLASPGWFGKGYQEKIFLAKCFYHALQMASVYDCKSIAFPLIFSGDYHIPRVEALKVFYKVVNVYLARHKIEIHLVLYNEAIYQLALKVKSLNNNLY